MANQAVLITRAWPERSAVAEFDAWQVRKHLGDLAALPGVSKASYYATRETGIPQVLQGSGNRMAAYWAPDLAAIKRWMTDPGLDAAIQDGSQFFGSFNELDGDVYTGNVYQLGPKWPGDVDPKLSATLLVERFEVSGDLEADFDDWMIRKHLPALRTVGGVGWVQWGRAVRGLPVVYYNSPGNRVAMAEFSSATIWNDELERVIADSTTWDRSLEYVRREVNDPHAVFDANGRIS